jgi:hypothetical protein
MKHKIRVYTIRPKNLDAHIRKIFEVPRPITPKGEKIKQLISNYSVRSITNLVASTFHQSNHINNINSKSKHLHKKLAMTRIRRASTTITMMMVAGGNVKCSRYYFAYFQWERIGLLDKSRDSTCPHDQGNNDDDNLIGFRVFQGLGFMASSLLQAFSYLNGLTISHVKSGSSLPKCP